MVMFEASEDSTRSMKSQSARLIAVANQKGGVGKTDHGGQPGAAAAELGHRVLIDRSGPSGQRQHRLGINPRTLQSSMYDVLLHDVPMDDAIEAAAVGICSWRRRTSIWPAPRSSWCRPSAGRCG